MPGNTVDDVFRDRPPEQREICEAIIEYLESLGPIHVDAVKVGVFLKHESKLAELRPKSKWLSLELVLPRLVNDPRISRTIKIAADRIVHIVKLSDAGQVDEQVMQWLTEAYDAAS